MHQYEMPRTPATAAATATAAMGPGVGGLRSPTTPRTVAFRTLDGGRGSASGGGGTGGLLPFRERYEGPDGR